ncbi:uncharacterized protein [Diadema setosum]|uniref:uncharacterized protein n=1 Tax=Diadema setosum TaxID=31175 RepID=UPI003B3AA48E
MKNTRLVVCSVLCFVLVAGVEVAWTADVIQCYQCQQLEQPVWSDCWNASESLPTVECEGSCFTSMFQSGGNSLGNYWNVKRGCMAPCEHTENCLSQHYGECKYCCSSNMCNTFVSSLAICPRISMVLATVSLVWAKLVLV